MGPRAGLDIRMAAETQDKQMSREAAATTAASPPPSPGEDRRSLWPCSKGLRAEPTSPLDRQGQGVSDDFRFTDTH